MIRSGRKLGFLIGAAVTAALAIPPMLPTAALATFPGRNGKIVLGLGPRSDCCYGLFTAGPNGDGLRQLTAHHPDSAPSFSGDGKRIAFARGETQAARTSSS